MNAMLGPTLRDVPALAHRNEIDDAQTRLGTPGVSWRDAQRGLFRPV